MSYIGLALVAGLVLVGGFLTLGGVLPRDVVLAAALPAVINGTPAPIEIDPLGRRVLGALFIAGAGLIVSSARMSVGLLLMSVALLAILRLALIPAAV